MQERPKVNRTMLDKDILNVAGGIGQCALNLGRCFVEWEGFPSRPARLQDLTQHNKLKFP